jgi:uncharacterized protein (DUF302 family)
MEQTPIQLGLHVHLNMEFEAALARVTAALKSQGFGVLTEIDVRETLKQKLQVDFRKYKILGACNPPLAHQALTLAPDAGLLLPCNVVVSESTPGDIDVSLVDPLVMLGVIGHPQLEPVAQAARARLQRVAQALKE